MSSPTQSTLFHIDPLHDSRWPGFVDRHPDASVFHTRGWLQALVTTYGYRSLVFTSSGPGLPLTNGVVCCQVNSWLTGRRLVSLPFSDHCDPLVSSGEELHALLGSLRHELEKRDWQYIELRPRSAFETSDVGFEQIPMFYSHSLDLRCSSEVIFNNFHRDSVRRKINRATREGLTYEEGRSPALLKEFYRLQLLTRRRHLLPPQPYNWFQNLIAFLGEQVKIHVASKDGQPIASILTLRYKNRLLYKYGCSDARFHNLGGMPYLFWKAIQDAKHNGAEELDLGRSGLNDEGLIRFKEHLGSRRALITYWRYSDGASLGILPKWKEQLAKSLFRKMPDGLLSFTGRMLYRHMG